MIVDIVKGLFRYIEAFSYISKMKLGRYFFYSGLIGLAVMAGMAGAVYFLAPILSKLLSGWADLDLDFGWFDGVTGVLSYLASSVFFLLVFKYLMLIFTAPLMSKLSEEVELYLSGDPKRELSIYNTIGEILRGARISLRNVTREIGLTVLLFLIGLFPVVGVIAAPLLLMVQGYYAGFGNLDFWAERHYDYRNTIKYMSINKGMCIGNGLPYILLLAIPIIGVFLAPPLATIAGTLHAESKRDF